MSKDFNFIILIIVFIVILYQEILIYLIFIFSIYLNFLALLFFIKQIKT
jgi:hypothetical protein